MNEKMKAGIIGFAVGDALGVPVEFLNRRSLEKRPITEMQGFGSHKVPAGTWSDDTSLMIATMDSINEIGEIDYNDIMDKFSEWVYRAKYTATNELFDIGISTRKAIYNYIQGNTDPTKCGTTGINENGNGSLMRMLPIAFYCYSHKLIGNEKYEIINNISSLTHAHEISRLGCQIYCDYVINLLSGKNKEDALKSIKKETYEVEFKPETLKQYEKLFSGKIKNEMIDTIKSSGYVVDSLEASIWCTLNSNNYEDSVIKAVNLGEDTDTIGAITGGINGVIYGIESIPQRWLSKLKKYDYLVSISEIYSKVIENEKRNGRKF